MAREYGHPLGIDLMDPALMEALSGSLGWSTSQELTLGTDEGRFSMQTDFQRPGYYTVQFNLTPPVELIENDDQIIRTYAEVIWSVAGNSVRRVLSVNDGVAISGAGEACRVTVFDKSTSSQNLKYLVSCQISPGTRPVDPNVPPMIWAFGADTEIAYQDPITVRSNTPSVTLLTPGESIAYNVPDDAGVNNAYFHVTHADITSQFPDVALAIEQRITPNSTQFLTAYQGNVKGNWLPLSPGCRSVVYTNNSGTESALVTHIWGVDG